MSIPILKIEQLNAFFGDKQVLSDVNFEIQAGQKMALVGESGSGKTVCAQGIIQLNPAVRLQGNIHFDGQNLLGMSEKQLNRLRGRDIGMVFQEPMTALNPVYTVGEQIAEVFRIHQGLSKKAAWQEAIQLLLLTGIEDADKKVGAYPFELSGGQRQRAMIAMAVAGQPKLLIADEPTTALDVEVQGKILSLLNQLQQQYQMAILYITHDLKLVKRFADQVIVLKAGKVVETGAVSEIFTHPQHEYTQMLLDSEPEPLDYQDCPAKTVFQAEAIGYSVTLKTGLLQKQKMPILANVSFSLFEGQTLGIIGESGSGKTTLARVVMRLYAQFSGKMHLGDVPWSDLKGKALLPHRHLIQMVFQDPFGALNPRMTVFDIVTEGLRLKGGYSSEQLLEQAQKTLQEVGLSEESLFRYPHEFSGGQRQRVAIARALIMQPKILVLDEPTSALDVNLQKQMIELLLNLQKIYGLTLLVISHDLSVIRALAHQVLVLKKGQTIEQADAATLFDKPNALYTKNLLTHFLP